MTGSEPQPRAGRARPARRWFVFLLLLLVVAGFVGGGVARLRVETGVDSFLPSQDPSLQRFEELSRSFGGDAIVVLLESRQPRGLLDSQQLPKVFGLEGELSRLPDTSATYGPASTLNQIAGQAQALLAELTGRRDGLRTQAEREARQRGASAAAVKQAGDQAVAAFDRRYGPLIVQGLPVGLPTLRNPRFVQNVIYNQAGEPRPQWRYVVPAENSLAILIRPREDMDQAATEALVSSVRDTVRRAGLDTTRVTVSGVPAIVAALGDEVGAEIPVIGAVAVLAIGLCLFLVPWTTRRRRLLPLLVTGLATGITVAILGWLDRPVSLGVVAFLPVLAGLGSYYPTYFARRARPRVVLVVAAGTIASFATLGFSPLPFVRDLGLTLALGIAVAVGVGWVVVRRLLPGPEPADVAAPPQPDAAAGTASQRTRLAVGAVVVALAALGWTLLPKLPLEANFQRLTDGLPALAEANHVQDVVGSSGELNVVLRGPDVLSPAAWQWMRTVQQRIVVNHGDEARPVLSLPGLMGFLGSEPTAGQIKAGVRLLPSYLTKAVLRDDNAEALLSYGVPLDDLQRVRSLVGQIGDELPPAPAGYTAELSGLPTVAVRGYDLVSGDRYLANLAGVVAAGLVLLIGLRRKTDGLRAILAAVLATGVELLLLWLTNTALDPLTVALGSLTAAVGCEFTVLMSESRRRRDPSLHRAVALATLTSAAGYAALYVSGLAVIRQFGVLLAGSVLLSYLAARLVVWVWRPADAPAARTADGEEPNTRKLVGV